MRQCQTVLYVKSSFFKHEGIFLHCWIWQVNFNREDFEWLITKI